MVFVGAAKGRGGSLPPSVSPCLSQRSREAFGIFRLPRESPSPTEPTRSPRRDGRGGEQGDEEEEESPAARMGSSGTTARASSRCSRPVSPGSAPSPRPRLGKEPQSPAKGRWPGTRPRLPFLRKPNSASLENTSVPGSPDPGDPPGPPAGRAGAQRPGADPTVPPARLPARPPARGNVPVQVVKKRL